MGVWNRIRYGLSRLRHGFPSLSSPQGYALHLRHQEQLKQKEQSGQHQNKSSSTENLQKQPKWWQFSARKEYQSKEREHALLIHTRRLVELTKKRDAVIDEIMAKKPGGSDTVQQMASRGIAFTTPQVWSVQQEINHELLEMKKKFRLKSLGQITLRDLLGSKIEILNMGWTGNRSLARQAGFDHFDFGFYNKANYPPNTDFFHGLGPVQRKTNSKK